VFNINPLLIIEYIIVVILITSSSVKFCVSNNIVKMANDRVESVIQMPGVLFERKEAASNNVKVRFATEVRVGARHTTRSRVHGFRGADKSKLDIDPILRHR
jgi:hypothetical protein